MAELRALGWVMSLDGTVVALDTAPLIYFIEKNPLYTPWLGPFFEAVERGNIQVVTSTLTLTEVLIHPFRQGNPTLARQYSDILLNARNFTTVPVSPDIAREAASIRAAYGVRTPDAIQLATAILGGATAFLTNDAALASIKLNLKLNHSGLDLIYLEHLRDHYSLRGEI
jgi:predicted nucleic acid-binding protein